MLYAFIVNLTSINHANRCIYLIPVVGGGGLQFIVGTENLFSVMTSDEKIMLLGIKGGGVGF